MHCTHDRRSQISNSTHKINPTIVTNLMIGLIIRVAKSQSEHDYLYITLFIFSCIAIIFMNLTIDPALPYKSINVPEESNIHQN